MNNSTHAGQTPHLTQSQFRMYSIGIVAVNKARGSGLIEVTPVELQTQLDGELTDHLEQTQLEGIEADGVAYQVNVKTTATIKAEWIPLSDTNRLTAPDVRRGEMVMIYQFADSDVYHWSCLKDMHHLRRLETVTYVFSADPNAPADPTKDNCYFLEISSHDGLVTFQTSKANGEPFGYTFQFNTKEGRVTLTDDADNYLHLDSNRNLLELRNANGCFFNFEQDNCNLNVVKDMNIAIGGDVNQGVGGSENTSVGASITRTAGSAITNSAPSITEDAASIALAGNVTSQGGSHGGSGNMKMQGDVSIEGVVEASQGANFGGTVHAKKIISDEPVSAPNV